MNTKTRTHRTRAGLAAVCVATFALTAACGDDDDSPDETDVDVVTSEVTQTSVVSVGSEVTVGTVVTSQVEVTETTTLTSEVVKTEPGVTTED